VPARLSLVDWLREELRLTGTHVGCEHGICGACSIMLDGAPVPPAEVKALLHQHLARVADPILGEGGWKLDDHMRNIPDHYHAHARPPMFWMR
jgi:carbon-monoxide dehydrogenase small subunit